MPELVQLAVAVVGAVGLIGAAWLPTRRMAKAVGRPTNGHNLSELVELVVEMVKDHGHRIDRLEDAQRADTRHGVGPFGG